MCNCGKEKIIIGQSLKGGATKSCGCLSKEISVQCNTKHGHSKRGEASKTYKSWVNMIQRCINPKNRYYHCYGGRGIAVCKRWMKFENFLEDMGESPDEHQIDRINNDGNYCKSNCRWTTPKQNSRNKRNNLFATYKNRTQLLIEWAEEFGVNYDVLKWRLNNGWPIEKALTTPVRKIRRRVVV